LGAPGAGEQSVGPPGDPTFSGESSVAAVWFRSEAVLPTAMIPPLKVGPIRPPRSGEFVAEVDR
jgi:hypothetical protein